MITITQTMYDKSCIDANKVVRQFFMEHFGKDEGEFIAEWHMEDSDMQYLKPMFTHVSDTVIKLFKTKGRGDPRVSFKDWKKHVNVGETLELQFTNDKSIEILVRAKDE